MKKCLPILKISAIMLGFVLIASMANAQKTAVSSTAWSLPATWSPVGAPAATDAVIIPSGITVTVDAASGACANLTINANAGAANGLTISGTNTLTIGGNVTLTAPTAGTSTLAVGAGTLTANGTISIPGSATASRFATVSVSTGTINCNAVTFSGTAAQARLTFTGAGKLNVGNGTSGTLGSGGTIALSSSTINYDGDAQTVLAISYSKLSLSGSGVKTLTGVTTVSSDMTLNGSATATTASAMTVGGNLVLNNTSALSTGNTFSVTSNATINAGTDFTIGGFNTTISGNTTVAGTLTHSSAAGTKTHSGNVIINNGGTWSDDAAVIPVSFGGNLQNDGTYNAGTGVHTFTANTKTFSGASGISIPNITISGSRTNSGTLTASTLTVNATLTNNGTITTSTALAGSSTLTQGVNAVLNIGGTATINTLTASANPNTVNYTGATQTIKNGTYNDLNFSTGDKTFSGGTTTINGDLTLSGTATVTTTVTINAGNLNIGAGTTFTVGAFTLDVTGTTIIDGTLISNSTTNSKSFGNLIINNGGLFNSSVNENYTVDGNFQINGTGSINSGTGTWTFSGSGTPTLSGSGSATITNADFTTSHINNGTFSFTNLDVAGTGAVTLTNNGTITVSTTLTGADIFAQGASGVLNFGGATLANTGFSASAVGNSVNYTAAAQTIRGVSYSNLTLSGSLAKTLGAATTVNGTLSMQGTASLALGAFALTYGPASTLEYAGSNAQTTTNTEFKTPAGPFNLKINNGSGVTLHAARTINGNLNLANGILTTNATNLLTINIAGTVVPEASNSSFVNGPISKIGTAAFKFPVGKTGTGYVPVEIGVAAASNTFTAEYLRGTPPNKTNITAPGINHISNCDYWTVNRSAGSSAVDLTLYWNSNNPCGGSSYVQNPNGIKAVHYDGTNWNDASTGVGTGTASDGSVTWVANNTFSPFALGAVIGIDNPLPVMFADVKAFEKNNGVQIDWSNLTERDLIKYNVERSASGVNFTAINQQLPRSNQNDKENYSAFDAMPFSGANYYRIKVLEISGKIIYSKVLRVDIGSVQSGFTLYPNPVKGNQISVGISTKQGQYTIKVVNTAGQEIYKKRITHLGGSMTQTVELPSAVKPGVYNMQISGDNYHESKMFVVQ